MSVNISATSEWHIPIRLEKIYIFSNNRRDVEMRSVRDSAAAVADVVGRRWCGQLQFRRT